MVKVIMHIDLNAFFATAEKLRDPCLIGKPLIIGGSGRAGIVSTCSYEARAYGVSSGMPTYKALLLCPNAILKNVDFNYYAKLSKQFFNFLKGKAKKIEPASIDEAFVDITDEIKGVNVHKYLLDLQRELFNETGLQCSIGVAPTRFLAKMASDMKKPMGLTILRRRDFKEKLYPLPIKDFFGIGKKTYPRLEEMGVKTIGDLAYRLNSDDYLTNKLLGKFSIVAKDWVNGYGDDEVYTDPFDPKSVGVSHTLFEDTSSSEIILENLKELSKEVSFRAKKENKKGKTVQIVFKDTNFKTHNKSKTVNKYFNDFPTIFSIAKDLYEKYFEDNGVAYRLLGVTLQNLVAPEDEIIQMSLFNYEEYEEKNKTKILINELNKKVGKNVFKTASEVRKNEN